MNQLFWKAFLNAWYKDIEKTFPVKDNMMLVMWHYYKLLDSTFEQEEQLYAKVPGFRRTEEQETAGLFFEKRENLKKVFATVIDLLVASQTHNKEEIQQLIEKIAEQN
jgi:hypothetical protein